MMISFKFLNEIATIYLALFVPCGQKMKIIENTLMDIYQLDTSNTNIMIE